MTDPQIPDAISSESLSSLLGSNSRIPLSSLIPSLDFAPAGSHAGILDLYVVFLQVILKSSGNGPTPVHVIFCCSALLKHVIDKVSETLDSPDDLDAIMARHGSKFPGIAPEELIERGQKHVRTSLEQLKSAQFLLDNLGEEWVRHMQAIEHLGEKGLIPPVPIPLPNERMISDQIIASLGFDRDTLEIGLGLKG